MTLLTALLVCSSSQHNPLDPDCADDNITIDSTLNLCSDLGVDPKDAILLTIAYELQSLSIRQWKKMSWV